MEKIILSVIITFFVFTGTKNLNDHTHLILKVKEVSFYEKQNNLDCEKGGLPDPCCSYWTVKIEEVPYMFGPFPRTFIKVSCTTGGETGCFFMCNKK